MADYPGVNPVLAERVAHVTAQTCDNFRGSAHGNAYARTTGESSRCETCHEPQWKHWLKQTANATRTR